MELWQEIFCNILKNEVIELRFPQTPNLQALFESKCYQALSEIKEIIEDDTLTDKDCFMKIEKIIRLFENLDSRIDGRHDFG